MVPTKIQLNDDREHAYWSRIYEIATTRGYDEWRRVELANVAIKMGRKYGYPKGW